MKPPGIGKPASGARYASGLRRRPTGPAATAVWVGGDALALATAVVISCAGAVALVAGPNPWVPIAAAVGAATIAVFGAEAVVCVAGLATFGLAPFIDPTAVGPGGVPIWILTSALAAGTMLLSWLAREAAGQRAYPLQASALALAAIALLAYTGIRLAAASPLDIPTLSGAFLSFPAAALVTYLWLSHPRAMANLRRLLPIAAAAVGIWAVAYTAAAVGACDQCGQLVSSISERPGLLGDSSRIYTLGQGALLGIVLILLGQALRRPSAFLIALTAAGYVSVAFQASRAQYVALAAGTGMLLLWQFRTVKPLARALMLIVTLLAVYAVVTGPVGERGLSGFVELRDQTGNAGYRLNLIDESSSSWTPLGSGVSAKSVDLGVNFDLGVPNTVLVLGFVGAVLQLTVLVLAVLHGLRSRSALGASLAAVFTMVLVARPSLPLLEYGPTAVAYGMAVGFLASQRLLPAAASSASSGGREVR